MLERERELAALRAAADESAGGTGRAVLIEAPAGVGKSTLLEHAARHAERRGLRVLRARGSELERDFAFGAVRQLFERHVDRRLLAGSAAAAAAVIDPIGAPVEPGFALLHALFWLVANVAAEQPLALFVDDLHWVDEASLRTLDYVARRAGELPLLLVGAARPAEPGAHAELLDALRQATTVVAPAPLSLPAVAQVVRGERQADDELCAAYHEASAGNPLYLRELLRAVPDGDAGAVRAAVVPSLGERILRRIGRVAPEARALTGALAVLGDGHALDRVAALAELDPERAADVALELVRIDILGDDDPAAFAHPVIRHTVYAELSSARRTSLHAGAAEALDGTDPDAVAAQLTALPPAGSAAVAERLRAAGLAALGRGATEVAVRRLQRALDEGAASPPPPELVFDLGRAEAAGRDPGCLPHLEEAFAAIGDERKPEVAVVLAEVLASAGAWEAVDRVVHDGLAVAVAGTSAHGCLYACEAILRSDTAGLADGFYADRPHYEAFAAGEDWAARAVSAVLARTGVISGRPRKEALAQARHAIAGTTLLAEHGGGSWAPYQALIALTQTEALDEAERFTKALALAGRRAGATLHTFGAMAGQGWLRARRGDLIAAAAALETVFEVSDAAGMTMWVTSLAFMFQDAVAERPSLAAIADSFDGIELSPRFAESYAGAMLFEARGRVALARGERTLALRNLEAVVPTYRAIHMGPAASPWRSLLALALAPDDPATAAALAAEELELARAAGYPRALGIALRTAGVLAADEALLRESLEVLEDTPAALERVYTQLELGALLRRAQRFPAAREHLAAALDGAARCGADRTSQRATDELAAAGSRPRRTATTGRAALTPRELRIAELAAAGRSNAEIAQELFVSLKTVETHLSHVYGKLGLSGRGSRSALASALSSS